MTVFARPRLLDEVTDFHDLVRVEAARGLVEDEHLRVVNHRLSQADALPVAL